MRPGQNKRMRGRNNRKGPNPLTRTYESNGPDVKIRGTAHHVAEKYLQLARDAHSSGDPVMAESYLQHAEHYFRLIAAAQLAQQQSQPGFARPGEILESDDDDDDDFGGINDRFASPPERAPVQPQYAPQQAPQPAPFVNAPQPFVDRQQERPQYQDRGQDRGQRPDRPFQDRNAQNRNRGNRDQQQRGPRDFGNDQPRFESRAEARPPAEEPTAVLPAFITGAAPRLTPQAEIQPEQPNQALGVQETDAEHEAANYHLRSRRRRRRPDVAGEGENLGSPNQQTGEVPVGE